MKLLKSFSLYTMVSILSAAANFLVLPTLSHHFSTAEYGVVSNFNAYVTILIPLIGIVASGLIFVEFYKVNEKKEFASLFSSIQIIPLLFFVPFALIGLLFGKQFLNILEIPSDSIVYILLIPILSVLTIFIETYISLLVVEKKIKLFSIFSLSKTVIEIGLTLLFVVKMEMGWQGRIYSWLIASCIFFVFAFVLSYMDGILTINLQKKYMIAGILFGLPLILHTLGKFVINQSDRIFITKMVSLEEAGLYNMGYQFGTIILILVTAFGNIFTPYLYERLTAITYEKKLQIVRLCYLFLAGMIFVWVFISILSPLFFSYFINEKFAKATLYIAGTGLGYIFWGIYIIFAGYIYFLKKNNVLAYLAIVNIVLNSALNYFLIKQIGAIGAVYATCISYLVLAIMLFVIVHKLYPMPWTSFKDIITKKGAKDSFI